MDGKYDDTCGQSIILGLRRLKRMIVSEEVMLDSLRGRARITNIPDGAVIRNVVYDWDRHAFAVFIQHDSFPEVPDGAIIPLFDPMEFERLTTAQLWACNDKDGMLQTHVLSEFPGEEKVVKFREFL